MCEVKRLAFHTCLFPRFPVPRFYSPVGLDISSSFDMLDHNILVRQLSVEFGITGTALSCLKPRPHQQHCRSYVRLCRSNIRNCRKNRSTCSIRPCCLDIVAGVDGALEYSNRSQFIKLGRHASAPVSCMYVLIHEKAFIHLYYSETIFLKRS